MKNPNIKTKVVHSESNPAWNVVGVSPIGGKYKIARIPYYVSDNSVITEIEKKEAFEHAEFISYWFNNSDIIETILHEVARRWGSNHGGSTVGILGRMAKEIIEKKI